MSREIDERIVSMQFDTKNFEQNANSAIGVLGKLKQSLKLEGASKGIKDVEATAKKFNISPLANAMDNVQVKWSAKTAAIDQMVRSWTSRIVGYGERIAKSFTIEPIMTGFQEYETQIGAIQTILANTESKGTTLDDVNAALDELNKYADMTIYNFTEMTRNIGTFTAAGTDLDTSVNAIKGIANLAAISGSTSQQASTAMYQLSQALASGTVKLMDWNSVVNAGMGGQVFQDALKETARVHKIAIDDMIEKNGSFRETLQEGWLTSEILTETLQKFTLASNKMTEEEKEQATAMLKAKGYTDAQVESIFKLGNTATDAATKVKTFTQLMDTLKEAAQSGWTQTWELLIGDFEEAKLFFTQLSDLFSGVIGDSAERRNDLLSKALKSKWDIFIDEINEAGISTETLTDRISEAAKAQGKNLDELIEKHGSLKKVFQSGALSSELLKNAIGGVEKKIVDLSGIERTLHYGMSGEDVNKIEELLENLGYKLTGADGKSYAGDGFLGTVTRDAIMAFQKAEGLTIDGLVGPETLKRLQELNVSTEELDGNFDNLIDDITELGGRDMIVESLLNTFKGLVKIFDKVGEAWRSVFEIKSDDIYGAIKWVYDLSESFKKFTSNAESMEKLRVTFEGLFSILGIGWDLISAVGAGIGKLMGGLLPGVGGGFLDAASDLGIWLIGLRDAIQRSETFTKVVGAIVDVLSKIGSAIGKVWDWLFGKNIYTDTGLSKVEDFMGRTGKAFATMADVGGEAISRFQLALKKVSEILSSIASVIGSGAKSVWEWFFGKEGMPEGELTGFQTFLQTAYDILLPIGNLIASGAKSVWEWFFGKEGMPEGELTGFQTFLQTAYDILLPIGNLIASGAKSVWEWFFGKEGMPEGELTGFQTFIENIKTFFASIKVFHGIKQWASTAFSNIKNFFSTIGEGIVNGSLTIGDAFKQVFDKIVESLKNFFANFSITDAFESIKTFFSDLWTQIGNAFTNIGVDWTPIQNVFSGFADFIKNLIPIAGIIVGGIALFKLFRTIGNIIKLVRDGVDAIFDFADSISKAISAKATAVKFEALGDLIKSIGATFLMIAGSIAIMALIPSEKLWPAVGALGALMGVTGVLMIVMGVLSKKGANFDGAANAILKMAGSFAIIAIAAKMLGGMERTDLEEAGAALGAFTVFVVGVMLATKLIAKDTKAGRSSRSIDSVAKMIMKLAKAFIVLAIGAKIIGSMEWPDLGKAGAALAAFGVLIGVMAKLSGKLEKDDKNIDKLSGLIWKLATAFLLVGVAAKIIGSMEWGELGKAGAAFGAFMIVMVGMMAATKLLGKNGSAMEKVGRMILEFAGAFLAVAVAAKIIGSMEWGDLGKAGAAFVVFMGTMVGMMAATKLLSGQGQSMIKVGHMILEFAGAFLAVAIAAKIIGSMEWGELGKAGAAFGAFMGTMVGMMAATKLLGKNGSAMTKVGLMMLEFSGALLVISGAVKLLSTIGEEELKRSTGAILMIGGLFAGMMALTRVMKAGKGNIGIMLVMVGVIAALATTLAILSTMDTDKMLEAAIGLSAVVLAVSAALAVLALAGAGSLATLAGVGLMVLVLGAVGVALDILSSLPNADKMLSIAAALSVLVLSLSASCLILAGVGALGLASLAGIGVLAAMLVALAPALNQFSKSTADITMADAEKMNVLGKVLAALTNAAKNIPRSGGLFQKIFGTVNLDGFATWINSMIPTLIDFAKTINRDDAGEIMSIDTDLIDTVVGTVSTLAEAASTLQGHGLGDFSIRFGLFNIKRRDTTADNLKAFSEYISSTFAALSTFAQNIGNLRGSDGNALSSSQINLISKLAPALVDTVTTLSNAASEVLDVTGTGFEFNFGLIKFGTKEADNLTKFGEFLGTVYPALETFAKNLAGLSNASGEALKVHEIERIVKLAPVLAGTVASIGEGSAAAASSINSSTHIETTGFVLDSTQQSNLMEFGTFLKGVYPGLLQFATKIATLKVVDANGAERLLKDAEVARIIKLAGPLAETVKLIGEGSAAAAGTVTTEMHIEAPGFKFDLTQQNGLRGFGAFLKGVYPGLLQFAKAIATMKVVDSEGAEKLLTDKDITRIVNLAGPLAETVKTIGEASATAAGTVTSETHIEAPGFKWNDTEKTALTDLGTFLSTTYSALNSFATTLGTLAEVEIDTSLITGLVDTVDTLSTSATTVVETLGDGWSFDIKIPAGWSFAVGSDNHKGLTAFGGFLSEAYTALSDFATTLNTNGLLYETEGLKINTTLITSLCDTVASLAKSAANIPKTGSWYEFWNGHTDFDGFIGWLGKLVDPLIQLSTDLDGSQFNIGIVTAVADFCAALATMGAYIPGFDYDKLNKFFDYLPEIAPRILDFSYDMEAVNGETLAGIADIVNAIIAILDSTQLGNAENMAVFSSRLDEFGTTMVLFSEKVAGINTEAVRAAAEAGKLIGETFVLLLGGNFYMPSGEEMTNDVKPAIDGLGDAMKSYSDKVAGINVDALTAASTAGRNIASTFVTLGTVDFSKINITEFKTKAGEVADALQNYSGKVAKIDTSKLASATTEVRRLSGVIAGLQGKDYSGSTSLKAAIDGLSTTSITNFETAFTNATETTTNAIIGWVQGVASGIQTQDVTDSWSGAAKFVVEGFAAGITAGKSLAITAAVNVAIAAYEAAKEELDINSPSRKFMELGMGVDEGFAKGITKFGWLVDNATAGMTDSALKGTQSAISRISDFIEAGIDTQPTIRPVLDLSNISAGASAINGMLNMSPSVGALANANAISASMSKRQNGGSNADVVSAIKNLGRKMNTPSNNYNINGITYDDGSNVAEAVQTLVRAARVGRRR